ncbi:MAG: extracellular solute-binding protein, partial [Treponema sp.]|nr:extracellular solute-binding protein [Treponema sp.]
VSLNANVVYYNKTLADELGITMPDGDYTWDDLVKICAEVYQKTGGKTYGMGDLRMLNAMETHLPAWCMTHLGKEPPFPWTDTQMNITGADVAAFMDYWNKAPNGVVLPPDEAATVISQVSVPSSVRRTFLEFAFSGTFAMYQSQTKDVLEMIEWPNNHKGKGNAVSARPGLVECVFNGSKNKPLAIDFLAWFANDAEAGRILKGVRGVLPSSTQRAAVLADPALLSDIDKKIFAIVDKVYSKPINPYSPGPTGVVYTLFGDSYMKAVGSEVAFGRITPEEAGKRFEEMMKEVLSY